jgi:hypothetical protein
VNLAADFRCVRLTDKGRHQMQMDLRSAVSSLTTAHMAQAVVETYKSSIRKGRRAPRHKKRALDIPPYPPQWEDLLTLEA